MNTTRQELGRWGEARAAQYLIAKGYTVLDRNIRTPYGEIDLVVKDREVLVFVEVKTRRGRAFGNAEESITEKKLQHMIESAEAYLQEHLEHSGDWRIDVIAIHAPMKDMPEITHYKNATI